MNTLETIRNLTEADFESAINAAGSRTVVIDFWAPWCGPCKMMAPVLDELASDHAGDVTIAKVNVDDAPDLAARFEIRSIPTLVFFKSGKEIDRITGVATKAALDTKLAEL